MGYNEISEAVNLYFNFSLQSASTTPAPQPIILLTATPLHNTQQNKTQELI